MKGVIILSIPKTDELFDISHTLAEVLLEECELPHLALGQIGDFIDDSISKLDRSYREVEKGVFISDDAIIWKGATLVAPTIIGRRAEIRPGAFIRGRVIVGDGAVIGNSTEVKNSIIFDEANLPHYNYVGDSIVGYRAHLGAGAIASNLRLDKCEVEILAENMRYPSGLRKFGAMIGDYAEIGCGSVLSPGSIICREAVIYPLCSVRGIIPERCVYDGKIIKERRY